MAVKSWGGGEAVVEAAGEDAFDDADRFAFALAFVEQARVVGAGFVVVADAVERAHVLCPVELAVASAVEAVAFDLSAGGFDRADAGERGEAGFRSQPLWVGGGGDDLGG